VFIVNILKIKSFLQTFCLSLALISCVNEIHFSGVNEKKYNQIFENYKLINYSKEEIIYILGPPMIMENSKELWIYRVKKEKGNHTFKKTIYNKTLKLKFRKEILESIEEIELN